MELSPALVRDRLSVNQAACDEIRHKLLEAARSVEGAWIHGQSLGLKLPGNADEFREQMKQRRGAVGEHSITETLIREAAAILRKVSPKLSLYESLKAVVRLFRSTGAKNAQTFYLRPEPGIPLPADIEHCPQPSPEYMRRNGILAKELEKCPKDKLPGTAIIPAFRALSVPTNEEGYTSGPVEGRFSEELLRRFGERAYPGFFAVLSRPGRYVKEARHANSMRERALKLAGKLPTKMAIRIFSAALEAGWTRSTEHLPGSSEKNDLLKRFQESPYGPPGQHLSQAIPHHPE